MLKKPAPSAKPATEKFARHLRDLTVPTPETEARLLQISQKIRDLAPWETLYESQILVVVNSQTGQKGFVSTIGNNGEQSGVLVYQGDTAFLQLMAIVEAIEIGEADPMEILQVPQVQLMFDGPRFLESYDKELLKRHKIPAKGAQLPSFRSIVPGYLPWRVSESEAQTLAEALEQWFEVVSRSDFSPEYLSEKAPRKGSSAALQLRARTPKRIAGGETTWSDGWADVVPEDLQLPFPDCHEALETFAKLPQGAHDLEIEAVTLPEPVAEKDERPYFPELVMLGQNGLVAAQEMTKRGNCVQLLPELTVTIANLLAAQKERPKRLIYASEMLEPVMEVVQIQTKVPAEFVDELPSLDAYVDGLEKQFGRPDEELFAEMLELLNAQPGFSDLLKGSPNDVKKPKLQ